MPAQERFKNVTHVDPDYFLNMILDFIIFAESDDLGHSTGSLTSFINNEGRAIAIMKVEENKITIQRLPRR